jgi:LacI family transcriptional regulator
MQSINESRPLAARGAPHGAIRTGKRVTFERIPLEIEQRDGWRRPTIAEIARLAGVGTATVDRALNGRGHLREATRRKVLNALCTLRKTRSWRIQFVVEAGPAFCEALDRAVNTIRESRDDVALGLTVTSSTNLHAVRFAQTLERCAAEADALIVVAREDVNIKRAVRAVAMRGVPIVCLDTDLPNSGRTTFVGSNHDEAGAAAAFLLGRLIGGRCGEVLVVSSSAHRGASERENSFRRVIAEESPALDVSETLGIDESAEVMRELIGRRLRSNGAPAGIYCVAGHSAIIGQTLVEERLGDVVTFATHEFNVATRAMLDAGTLDFVVGSDICTEVSASLEAAISILDGAPVADCRLFRDRIFTKYSSG